MPNTSKIKVRLFVDASDLQVGELIVKGEEHHYLSKVRRLAQGQKVTLFDGEGRWAEATLKQILKKQSTLDVAEPQIFTNTNKFKLCIAPALIKGERMEQAISKMVELGVEHIYPTTCQRSIVRLSPKRALSRHKRFVSLAKAASRQCQNPYPSKVAAIKSFTDFLALEHDYPLKLIPCLSPKAVALRQILSATPSSCSSALVLIGPEGGFSDDEIQLAQNSGFLPVNLGPLTLRAETACITMASILSYCYGHLGKD